MNIIMTVIRMTGRRGKYNNNSSSIELIGGSRTVVPTSVQGVGGVRTVKVENRMLGVRRRKISPFQLVSLRK